MRRSRLILPLLALAVVAAAPPARAAAPAPLATVFTPALSGYFPPRDEAPLRSWRGIAVLSLQDPATAPPPGAPPSAAPRATSFQLAVSRDGAPPVVLPVRAQRIPFDADVGPGPDGTPQIVYSRCRSDAAGQVPVSPETGCDLYRFDLAAQTETRIAVRSSATADETLPTIWRDRIAWVSVRNGGLPRVLEGALAGGAARAVSLVPGRECGYRSFSAGREQRVCRATISATLRELDLYDGRLAAVMTTHGVRDTNGNEEVRTVRIGGTPVLLARVHPGEMSIRRIFLAIHQTPTRVGFVATNFYDGDTLYRWNSRTRTAVGARVGRETYGLAPEPTGSLLRIRPLGTPNAQSLVLVRDPAPPLKPATPPVHAPA